MTTANIRELEIEIERLVGEHIAACELAAASAVQRAFGSKKSGRSKTRKRVAKKRSRTSKSRRTSKEMAEFGERFYAAVCAQPGETMRVLAAEVGASARELHRPVASLKRAGRVRSVGQRSMTRYFPMTAER